MPARKTVWSSTRRTRIGFRGALAGSGSVTDPPRAGIVFVMPYREQDLCTPGTAASSRSGLQLVRRQLSCLCRAGATILTEFPQNARHAARRPRPPLRVDVPRPEPETGQVLITVQACGICRTDLHVCDGELPNPKLPLVLGHEIVGTVVTPGVTMPSLPRAPSFVPRPPCAPPRAGPPGTRGTSAGRCHAHE